MSETTRHDRMINAAVWLAENGCYIGWGPVHDGKAVKRKWKSDMTNDAAMVPRVLAGARNSLVIAAGRVVILDTDKAGWYERLRAVGLPDTFTVISPTRNIDPATGEVSLRYHSYGLAPEGFDVTRLPGAWQGGEVRRSTGGEQSMVLGPWAKRDDGVYEVPDDAPRELAVYPVEVLEFVIANPVAKPGKNGANGPVVIRVAGGENDEWKWDDSMGSRHDHIRDRIRFWRGTGIVGQPLFDMAVDYIIRHGMDAPDPVTGRVFDLDEIERMCAGAEEKYTDDRPDPAVRVEAPPVNGEPKARRDGIGWTVTASVDGHDLALTVHPSTNGIRIVEASIDSRVIVRNTHESLGSLRFRNTLADELSSLCGWKLGTSPWYWLIDAALARLDDLNQIVSTQFTIEAGEKAEDDHPEDRLVPFARAGMNSSLIALPGRGKTRLVTGADITLATAQPVVPGILPPNAEPVSVVQFNWENPRELLLREAARLARGAGIDWDPPLHFVPMTGPITARIEAMARIVDAHDAAHIDIDSFQAAIGASGASGAGGDVWGATAEAVFDAIDSVRRLTGREHLSALLIDHAKGNPGAAKVDKWERRNDLIAYGSTRKAARLRASYGQMVTDRAVIPPTPGRIGEARRTLMSVGIVNIKPWADREPDDDLFFDFIFSSGVGRPVVRVEVGKPPSAPSGAGGGATEAKGVTGLSKDIRDLIAKQGPLTVNEIAAATGKPADTVRKTMNRRADLFGEVGGRRSLRLPGVEEDPADEPSYDLS